MKKVLIVGTLIIALAASCSGNIETSTENEVSAAETINYTSLDDLTSNHNELEGKEITIEAVSWGNSGMADGTFRMSLGGEKLTGLKQAHTVVNYDSSMESLNNVEKDQTVVIKATVGESAYGAIHLNNPELISVD